MKYAMLFGPLLWATLSVACARPMVDSVGTERKDGKRFILHRVDQGQTLFAIARRYGVSVDALVATNPDVSKGIRYDQLVRVPMPADAPTAPGKTARQAENKPSETPRGAEKPEKGNPATDGIHVVATGETLFNLAGRYSTTVEDLREWNGLPSDQVRIGQALIVSKRAYLDRQPNAKPEPARQTPSARPTPTPAAPRPETAATTKPESVRPTPPATPTPKPKPDPKATAPRPDEEPLIRPGTNAPLPTTGRRVSEIGLAELIDDSQGSSKFLALHRTAPIGTLVLVRNDDNSQSIWVKVIGRIPDTGVNDKVLIKVSARAFQKLSPTDRRFRAEVSYVAP